MQESLLAIHEFKNHSYSNLVLSTLYHLEHSFQQDFLISDLAAELDVSVNYLIKRFKEETGHTPRQFLLKKRLKHAAWLLVSTTLPIQEICLQSGISDANYFSRLFLREYGESPGQYRKKHHL